MSPQRSGSMVDWLIAGLCNPTLQSAQQASLPGLTLVPIQRPTTGAPRAAWFSTPPGRAAGALASQGGQP